MIKHLKYLSLHFRSMRLFLKSNSVLINNLHGVEGSVIIVKEFICGGVTEATEVNGAYVAGAYTAEEMEVTEGEAGFADGGVGKVGRTVRFDGERFRRGGWKQVEGETAEAGAANAFTAAA